VIQVAANYYSSVALKSDGRVVACGSNSQGQGRVPMDLGQATQVAGGFHHNVVVLAPRTPGDLDNDGMVNGADLVALLGVWVPAPSGMFADLNHDGQVDDEDLGALIAAWTG
jgi:hypothetical protein